jgi:hypothetical protein
MTTEEFITALFCHVDDQMTEVHKHPQAHLYPSELVTLALPFALKGVGDRALYRWLKRDWYPCFPACPTAHACSGSFKRIARGPTAFWPIRPSLGSRTPTALNYCTPCAKAGVRLRLAQRANRTIVGLSATNCACSCINSG